MRSTSESQLSRGGAPSDSIARPLRASLAKLNRRLRSADESIELGSTALSLMGRLVREGPSTATRLAARERLQPQSLTRTLRVLEGRGLIFRTTDRDDRRRSTIVVTAAGIAALRASVLSRESWLARALDSTLTPAEREMLRIAAMLLERLADVPE